MKKIDLSELTPKFIKAYSNLPIKTREEILIVIDKEPITWKVAYMEITNNTNLGKKILVNLKKLGMFD